MHKLLHSCVYGVMRLQLVILATVVIVFKERYAIYTSYFDSLMPNAVAQRVS